MNSSIVFFINKNFETIERMFKTIDSLDETKSVGVLLHIVISYSVFILSLYQLIFRVKYIVIPRINARPILPIKRA